jgi:hypothetical protein
MMLFARAGTAVPILAAILMLTGCNSVPQQGGDPGGAVPMNRPLANVTPPGFKLPEGTGCEGDAQRFRAVLDNDLAMGHVNKSVYTKAVFEVDSARKVCSSGADARARAMLSGTRRRYGYPG